MVLVAKYYLVHLILYLRMYTCIAYSLLTIGKPWWKATVQKKNCHEHTLSIAENKRNNCQKKKNENIKMKIKSSFFVKINEYLSILNIVTLTYYLYDIFWHILPLNTKIYVCHLRDISELWIQELSSTVLKYENYICNK